MLFTYLARLHFKVAYVVTDVYLKDCLRFTHTHTHTHTHKGRPEDGYRKMKRIHAYRNISLYSHSVENIKK